MTSFDDLLYLPSEAAFADMMSGALPRVVRAKRQQDRGDLVVEEGSLEFEGLKGTVRFAPLRGLSHDRWLKIEYGEGSNIRVAYVGSPKKVGGSKKNRQMLEAVQRELGGGPLGQEQDEELSRFREQSRAGAARSALIRMWIGLAVVLVGIVVTAVTFSAAEPGGTYFVAYGAILFGGLAFLQGLVEWRKKRG